VLWALPAGGINAGVNHEIHNPRLVPGDDDCGPGGGMVAGPSAANDRDQEAEGAIVDYELRVG